MSPNRFANQLLPHYHSQITHGSHESHHDQDAHQANYHIDGLRSQDSMRHARRKEANRIKQHKHNQATPRRRDEKARRKQANIIKQQQHDNTKHIHRWLWLCHTLDVGFLKLTCFPTCWCITAAMKASRLACMWLFIYWLLGTMHVGYAAFHYLKLFGFTGLICALVNLCLFSALSLLWDASCHCCYGWCNSSSCSGTAFSLFCVCRCEHQRAYKTQAMIGHSVDRWATRYLQLCTEMFIIGFRKIRHIHF